MQSLTSWASEAIGLSPTTQIRLLTTLSVIVGLLLVRWMVLKGVHRRVTDAIWQDVLRAFAACPDVDLAYPTTRFYANDREEKPGKGAPGSCS